MTEILVNSINERYNELSKILVNSEIPESLSLDTYNSFPIDVSYIDYGYIKLSDGFSPQMFVACATPNDYRSSILYLSKDGITWADITLPDEYKCVSYNKILVYNGDVYLLYDDEVIRVYNFDIITQTASVEAVTDNIYDMEINLHELFLLTDNGVYKIGHDDITPEFIEIQSDIPFEKFVPSINGKLIIMGYGDGYPLFIVCEDQPRLVICATKCRVVTAISYNDKILCYTDKNSVIDVHRAYDLFEAKETVYEGQQWCGNVTYHHCYFWLSYIEYDSSGNTYTVVARSSNGINFDPDVKIPHVSNMDGISVWGNSYTYCLCAGNLYTLKTSEKYSDYGFPFIKKFSNVEISSDGSVSIDTDMDISDFDKYVFSPYLVGEDMVTRDTTIRYDIVPHIENGYICFKLANGDYSGLTITAYYYGVVIIY